MTIKVVDVRRMHLAVHGRAGLPNVQDAIDESRNAERQNRIHVIPQFPFGQHAFNATFAAQHAVPKAIQEGVEVVVVNDQQALTGVLAIVFRQMTGDLQTHGGFARSFLAKHDCRGRFGRVAVDLVPGRMISADNAVILKHRVGLRILFGKGIPRCHGAGGTAEFSSWAST